MPGIAYDSFDFGIDLRRGAATSAPNRFRMLDNCYITTGKEIKKRPGLELVATLEAGTVGLKAGLAKLNTFYNSGSITHANPLFKANKVVPPYGAATNPKRVWYCDAFNGYIYTAVEYVDSSVKHHYLKPVADYTAWEAGKVVSVGDIRRPSTPGSFVYVCSRAGTTGTTEPTWSTTYAGNTEEAYDNYDSGVGAAQLVTLNAPYKLAAWSYSIYKCTKAGYSFEQLSTTFPLTQTTIKVDDTSYPAFAINTGYAAGQLIRPSTANGWVYEVYAAGVSGGSAPTWPTTLNSQVVNGTATFKAVWRIAPPFVGSEVLAALGAVRAPTPSNGKLYKVLIAGTCAASAPTWPTTVGSKVVSGTVTFECVEMAEFGHDTTPVFVTRNTSVWDANCPHGKGVIKASSKIWSTKGAAPYDTVWFSATDNCLDWTASSDAGFIAVALKQDNAQDCRALGQFQNKLACFFQDSTQLWDVDTNPANNKLAQRIFGVGTRYPLSPASFSDDVFFLADQGVRSITVNQVTANLQDSDIGSPIDSIVMEGADLNAPYGIYLPPFGQFWLIMGSIVWVYTFSRNAKLAAWSRYSFPYTIDDIAVLDNIVYVRNANKVYKLNKEKFTDDGSMIQCRIVFPFLDGKLPGVDKMYTEMDLVIVGSAAINFMVDNNDPGAMTDPLILTGDTRSGPSIPVEICAPAIAPVIQHAADEDFKLTALTMRYERL